MQGFNGGRVLLNNTENYGVYLAEALVSPTVDTSQYGNGITIVEKNIGRYTNTQRDTVGMQQTYIKIYALS